MKGLGFLKKRKARKKIIFTSYYYFTRVDVFTFSYRLCGFGFAFTGLCMGVNQKCMLSSNTTFSVRNIFAKVAVEVHSTFYNLCRLTLKMLDYARKKLNYRVAKLYYLRNKMNKQS
jgi:hypothetical protein